MPSFEFDPDKSLSNKRKHGIDFLEAQQIWTDDHALEAPVPSITEPRFQLVGFASGKLWSAIVTYRADKVRIISVRAARADERRIYETRAKEKGEADGGAD
jgi:hypothetical protein